MASLQIVCVIIHALHTYACILNARKYYSPPSLFFFTKEILCFCDNIILSAGYGAKSARVINAYCTEGLKVDSVIMRK